MIFYFIFASLTEPKEAPSMKVYTEKREIPVKITDTSFSKSENKSDSIYRILSSEEPTPLVNSDENINISFPSVKGPDNFVVYSDDLPVSFSGKRAIIPLPKTKDSVMYRIDAFWDSGASATYGFVVKNLD